MPQTHGSLNPPITCRLRFKLIVGVMLVTLSLCAVLTALLGHASLRRYKQFEERAAHQQIDQAVSGLAQMQSRLSVIAEDWANWDDAYAYVQSPDPAFTESNLGATTFESAGVDLIAVLDADNRVLAAEGYDLPGHDAGWVADATPYARAMLQARPAIAPPGPEPEVGSADRIGGVVPYDGQRWLITSQPVLGTDGSGPVKGRLIFATQIDGEAIAELRDRLHLDVAIGPPDPRHGTDAVWFETDGLATLRAYVNVSCVSGTPALGLTLVTEREIYQAGVRGLLVLALSCLGAGVLIAICLGVLLERLVIRRLERLAAQAQLIGQTDHANDRFREVGSDEIARLAESMNRMLTRLDDSRRELERTQHTVDLAGSAIFWLTPDGRFRYVNGAACEMSGYTESELIGRELCVLDPNWTPVQWAQRWDWFRLMDPRVFETICRRKNGELFEAEVRCSRMVVDDEEFLFAILGDISQRKAAERRLVEMATTDGLTGLPNRAWLLERLGAVLDPSASRAEQTALLYLDLDRFKLINDAMGHAAGDEMIRAFAERVSALLEQGRSEDGTGFASRMVRLGGDEFVVLLEHEGPSAGVADLAQRLARRVIALLAEPFTIQGQAVVSTASIGIVDDLSGYRDPDDALRDADTAMYAAKHEGRNAIRRFNAEMHKVVVERLRLERGLREAAAERAFELYYQPIIDIQTNEVHGFEALLRWNRADGTPVSPDVFIPIAEETGLIQEIGVFIIEQACGRLAAWNARFPWYPLTMAINISRRQLLVPGLIQTVRRVLGETGVDPARIEFEITEGILIEDYDAVIQVLNDLRGLGIQLSMDDFGTGYSSLSCLHQFPTQLLKIDRAFIANMSMNIEYAAITHAIVTLAHNLGMRVIAEGIEDAGQLAQLQALDCDFGQGYLFSRPMPVDQADQWLDGQLTRRRHRSMSA